MPRTVTDQCTDTFAAAEDNRGVSVVVIPGEIALQQAVEAPPSKRGDPLSPQSVTVPSTAEPDPLAAFLNGDGHVTIVRRSGCGAAHEELLALGQGLKG